MPIEPRVAARLKAEEEGGSSGKERSATTVAAPADAPENGAAGHDAEEMDGLEVGKGTLIDEATPLR